MAFWALLLIQVGLQIVSGLLTSKNAKPEKELDLPQVDASTPIPVPFGECLVQDAMLLDYFDFKAVPVKVRNPATFFITKITVGYKYYLGMVFGIGWGHTPQGGEGTVLTQILIDNRHVWQPGGGLPEQGGNGYYRQNDPIYVHRPSLFGSEKQEGGVTFKAIYYNGADMSVSASVPMIADAYWETQRGVDMPHYEDIAYFVWYGPSTGNLPLTSGAKLSGHIGNAPRLWPISFKVYRQPIDLTNGSIGRPGDTPSTNGDHANPLECLYECLVSTLWGAGISSAHIDGGSGAGTPDDFAYAAATCWTEGLGFSYLWTTASPVEEMIAEILRYVDGALWTDPADGLIKVKLARADYALVDLPSLSNDDFLEIESFTRGSWRDTKNEVRVTFPDHSRADFEENTATWRNPANYQIQGANEPAEIVMRGCPSLVLGNKLAAREGRVVSTPLVRLKGTVDRKAWELHPCSVFKFNWPEQGISDLPMRITTMSLGTLTEGTITISAIEDVFGEGSATYSPSTSTVWTDPLGNEAVDAPSAALGEVPYWFQRDSVPRVFGVAEKPDSTHVAYSGALDNGDTASAEFTPTGTLQADLGQLSETDYDTTGFVVEAVAIDADLIEAGTATTIATQGAGLFLIGDPASDHEWIAAESVTDNLDGTVTLDNVWRGLLDTPPRTWTAGDRVWFFAAGSALFGTPLSDGQAITFEALTRTMRDQLRTDEATDYSYTTQSRALRPLPPYYVQLGGSYTNLRQDSGDLVFTWREHSRLTALELFKQSATTDVAEAGVEYEIDIYGEDDTTLLRTETGISSPTYTYLNTDELADTGSATLSVRLRFEFWAIRDGYRSLYPWIRYVYRVDPATFGGGELWGAPLFGEALFGGE